MSQGKRRKACDMKRAAGNGAACSDTFSYKYPVSNLTGCVEITSEGASTTAHNTLPQNGTSSSNSSSSTSSNRLYPVFQSSDYGEGRALQATPLASLREQLDRSRALGDETGSPTVAASTVPPVPPFQVETDIKEREPLRLQRDEAAWEQYENERNLMAVRREYHRIRVSTYRINPKDHRRQHLSSMEIEDDDWHEDADVAYLTEKTLPYAFDSHTLLREICFMMPVIVDERHWMRHALSWEDVMLLLNACPKTEIWRKTLFDGISLLNSASKSSWISATSMIIGGKRNAINKQQEEIQDRWPHWAARGSGLLHMSTLYKNPIYLPFRHVPAHVIDLCRKHVPQPHTTEMWLGQPVRVYDACLFWKEHKAAAAAANPFIRHYVPLAVYEHVHQHYDFVLLNRVLPYPLYKYLHSEPNCVAEWPDVVRVRDNIWALCDEAMWVWSETTVML